MFSLHLSTFVYFVYFVYSEVLRVCCIHWNSIKSSNEVYSEPKINRWSSPSKTGLHGDAKKLTQIVLLCAYMYIYYPCIFFNNIDNPNLFQKYEAIVHFKVLKKKKICGFLSVLCARPFSDFFCQAFRI